MLFDGPFLMNLSSKRFLESGSVHVGNRVPLKAKLLTRSVGTRRTEMAVTENEVCLTVYSIKINC